MTSLEQIRSQSFREAEELGYPINRELPLLGELKELRSKHELTNRILCLNAVVATAWGHPRELSLKWIEREQLIPYMSDSEKRFLHDGVGELELRWQVEGLWALAWCAGFVDDLNFAVECSDELVTVLPDLQKNESSPAYCERIVVRDVGSIVAKCDLAYCLHWAIRDAALRRQRPPGSLHPIRVVERRRALEWMLTRDDWDSVALDT